MNPSSRPAHEARFLNCALREAETAARAAGSLLRRHLLAGKKVQSAVQHDIKLELDVRCQRLIERHLRRALPEAAILGEEESYGDLETDWRWVVDPIDGTVNYTYGIPHACVSIALQCKWDRPGEVRGVRGRPGTNGQLGEYQTQAGLVYDPFCDELWTAIRGGPARLNRRVIRAGSRTKLGECVIAMGFSKGTTAIQRMLPVFQRLLPRVRKIRMMGAAALDLAYVATGRLDAYLEGGVRIWDIAAGGLLVECAGGEFWREPISNDHGYRVLAGNRPLRSSIERAVAPHWPWDA